MSATQQKVRFDLSPLGFTSPKLQVLVTSFTKPLAGVSRELPMEPYSAFIAKITR
jgi:hypothetical protein